jgi:hypothetical protein
MPDYSKGKIYTIRCRSNPNYIYVGSTIQSLAVRLGGHKNLGKTNRKCLIYSTINNDWTDWYIELYENYPCENREQLCKREGEVIREIATLNINVAGRTFQEYKIENADWLKQYDLEKKLKQIWGSKKRDAFFKANPDFVFKIFDNVKDGRQLLLRTF